MPMAERVRRGRSAAGRAELRRALVMAAVELFRTNGYDETTIDDIAVAAGVGRRTFFRYFRGKEDAISPDHEAALARIAAVFESAHSSEPVTALALRAGETVFDLYFDDPALSVRRFALTHQIDVLRDRESACVDHYRRLITRQLRQRLADQPDGELRATVIGAAVVAAHNLALRTWLAAGAPADRCDTAREQFRRVTDLLPPDGPGPPGAHDLHAVTRRLEQAITRLERSTP